MIHKKGVRKRIILINRDLQFRYARIALVVGFVSTLLSSVVILYPLYQFEILRIPRFLPLPILMGMICAVLVNMLLILMLAVLITHRIAGPMYALSREFEEMSQGFFGRELRGRKMDDLRYLIRRFNELSSNLRNITYDDREKITLALEQLMGLQKQLESDNKEDPEAWRFALRALQSQLQEFHHQLSDRIVDPASKANETSQVEKSTAAEHKESENSITGEGT